ncbi:class I SAM-dependent methyltransferase [Roseibium limicola]|uniref:Methyltransferase domain-containing protein n=1 Tax=Roseibium limicola TaxID=2816037 RepID=A0A939EN79_9HYPH|nr:class I SAM-dependent methyltransferase [Roseibium limicola]MBO0345508.1 methyltransferase domain-containing protein [Roseibium limicola]
MSAAADTARVMDGVYRNQRHIYDLTRKYYLLGRDVLIDRLAPPVGAQVLEVGCGTGRNLIAAAKRYPDAQFYGFDISSQMLETARANVAKAGLSDRIALNLGDASDPHVILGFGQRHLAEEGFDRVFFSYTLSMIPVWQQALVVGSSVLKADGRMSVVDFGQQDGLPRMFRHGLFAWLKAFHVEPRAELRSILSDVAGTNGYSESFSSLYRGYAVYAELQAGASGLHSPATK